MASVDNFLRQCARWQDIWAITAVPACAMLVGSAAVSVTNEPSERLQATLQHFSGGLLIGAVVTDIFPILKSKLVHTDASGQRDVNVNHIMSGAVGFIAAIALMHLIKSMGLDDLGDGEEGEDSGIVSIDKPECAMSLQFPSDGNLASKLKGQDSARIADASLSEPMLGNQSKCRNRSGLQLAVERLTARAAALGQLATEDDVDRDAVDEEVHALDFLLDVASRRCQSDYPEPLDPAGTARMRVHVGDLCEQIQSARTKDATDLPAIHAELHNMAIALRRIHPHTEQRAVFRRWCPRTLSPTIQESPSASPTSCSPRPCPSDQESNNLDICVLPASAYDAAIPVKGSWKRSLPWGLVLAVLVDSVIDGMLIGLAGSVAVESGWLMAIATAIEMGFLGYSFACSVARRAESLGGRPLKYALMATPPFAMLIASVVAAAGASNIKQSAAFVGLIAFALAAVLFLVVEELLLEAHEREDSEQWSISVWLYVGLLLSICLDVMA